ncbi:MAG: DUF202 domain-containing protein [Candidatus Fermentibacteraceae bacterium]
MQEPESAEEIGPLRDELATSRTYLATERTFLAYVRTAIMLGVSGISLVKLLHSQPELVILGYALMPLAIAVAIVGLVRFIRTRRFVKTSQDESMSMLDETPPGSGIDASGRDEDPSG